MAGFKALRKFCAGIVVIAMTSSMSMTTQAAEEDWSFSLAPYFWMSGLKGDVAPFAALPPVSVDASFSDVFDTLRMAGLLAGEARKGRWALVGDIQYYDLEADANTPAGLYTGVVLGAKLNVFSGGIAYRLSGEKDAFVDGIASLRYMSVDTSLVFLEGLLPSLSASASDSWVDPMLGVKGRAKFSERWSALGWAMFAVGGDSDSSWDAYAAVSYRLSDRWQAQMGYRQMKVDYTKGGFVYDMTHAGPMLGVSYTF